MLSNLRVYLMAPLALVLLTSACSSSIPSAEPTAAAFTPPELEPTITLRVPTPFATQQKASIETPTGIATAVHASPSNPDEEIWGLRLNHSRRVQFQIPATWELVSGTIAFYRYGIASLELSLEDRTDEDAADACRKMTQGFMAAAFGAGSGEVVTVNGLDVCVLYRPQSEEPYRAYIKYPQPVEITGMAVSVGGWNFLRVDVTPADYFWRIVESISMPDEPSAQLYVSGMVDHLKANYYFRNEMDWDGLEAGLYARLDEKSTLEDAYDALRWLMDEMAAMVNHHHMVLQTPEAVQDALKGQNQQVGLLMSEDVISLVFPNSPAAQAGLQMGDRVLTVNGAPFAKANFNVDQFNLVLERAGKRFEATLERQAVPYILPPRSQRLGDVAYLETFGIFGADLPLLQAYATDVQTAIKDLDSGSTCGWILDVRRNTGGSIHAIFAGIAPLVGEGRLYLTREPDGQEDPTYYEDGRVFGNKTLELPAMIKNPYELKTPNPPMAVLISHGTGSAGEVSAIIVSGRPGDQARIFGEKTPGLTTPVWSVQLYDGGVFHAPASLMVDLEGNTYLGGVIPDEPMTVVYDASYGTKEDPLVQAAMQWLKAEYGCSP